MNSLYVMVPVQQWLRMSTGDVRSTLDRLGLPDDRGVEVGPSLFRLMFDEGFVELELRHEEFPEELQMIHIDHAARMFPEAKSDDWHSPGRMEGLQERRKCLSRME